MKYVMLIIIGLMLITSNAAAKGLSKDKVAIAKKIMAAADVAEVPRELVLAVCFNESGFRNTGVTHLDGETVSHGICQMKLETAQFMDQVYRHKNKATPERLENPRINAFYAAKLLKYQLHRYDDEWELAVDAYNKGTAVSKDSVYVKHFKKSLSFIKKHIDYDNRKK